MPVLSKLRKAPPTEISKEPGKDLPRFQTIHFEIFAPEARAVFLAGSFNDWDPNTTPMQRHGEVKWAKELLLPPGHYQYRFVVDGMWIDDPKARAYVSNPHGGRNAVLEVI